MINSQDRFNEDQTMGMYDLIKSVKEFDIEKAKKPKIDYSTFDVIVEGKEMTIGIPIKETKRFEAILQETDAFTRRKFRMLMREFRGIRTTK